MWNPTWTSIERQQAETYVETVARGRMANRPSHVSSDVTTVQNWLKGGSTPSEFYQEGVDKPVVKINGKIINDYSSAPTGDRSATTILLATFGVMIMAISFGWIPLSIATLDQLLGWGFMAGSAVWVVIEIIINSF